MAAVAWIDRWVAGENRYPPLGARALRQNPALPPRHRWRPRSPGQPVEARPVKNRLFSPGGIWHNIGTLNATYEHDEKECGFSRLAPDSGNRRSVRAAGAPCPAGRALGNQYCATAGTNALGPKIQFATREGDFGRVRNGEIVKYTYWFTNTGDQVLKILNVAPGCGCTTAGDWTKTVEPGKTGSIPIQFQTANFNGPVTKFITVTCDDKSQSTVVLQLKGTIWKPIDVNPSLSASTFRPTRRAPLPSSPSPITPKNRSSCPVCRAATPPLPPR